MVKLDNNDEYRKKREKKVKPKYFSDNFLNEFLPYPHKLWIKEDISYDIQKLFDIRYNVIDNQIIIPKRDIDGKLVSIKARNLNPHDIKYVHIVNSSDGNHLYPLWINKDDIFIENKVIIVESEKSVLKAFNYGFKNILALGSNSITKQQRKLIREYLNEDDGEIIFALDKDLDLKHIERQRKKFKDFNCNFSYIIDEECLIGDKDSPLDMGKEVFIKLYNNRKVLE